jgi:hypothetical protein
LALDERSDVGPPRTFKQITFPMTGQRAVRNVGWSLANRDGINDLPLARPDASARAGMSKVALAAELPE